MNEFIDITNIQRFSLDDGPGIRTTVFLTKCNMRCAWCHNPENLEEGLIAFEPSKCKKCGKCVDICKRNAHFVDCEQHIFDREKCVKCFACVKACPTHSLHLNSYNILIDDLINILIQDYDFYKLSCGGVTLSGGEPVMQWEALDILIKKLRRKKINIAIETALNYKFEKLNSFLDEINLFIVDLKAISNNLHKKYTGSGNEMILDNLFQLSGKKKLWIRIPVVPEINMSLDEIRKIGKFLQNIQAERVELIPYHCLGISKYNLYGMQYRLQEVNVPTPEYIKKMVEVLNQYNLAMEVC